MKAVYAALDVMQQHLENNKIFVANQCTIADITLYAYEYVAEEGNLDLSGYDNIKAWFKRIEGQENYSNIKM
jgi:glutathione S-transferase